MDLEALKRSALFKVGDTVWTRSSGPWTVRARYWSPRKGTIVYDLVYENGTVLERMSEVALFSTRQFLGYAAERR